MTVVVLGAGPAGVGAAYRLARDGHRVVVLERAGAVGGAAGSFEVAGLPVDHGSHRLHPAIAPEILAHLRALLGDALQLRPRRGRIHLQGRWIDFPLRTGDLLRHLPPSFALTAARDTLLAPARRAREDTFAEVLRAKLGPTLCERFYFPYARKLWGVDPEELSGEQARRRVSADSPWRLLGRVLRGQRGGAASFWYPQRGYGQLWDALADAAAEAGADIRLHRRVAAVCVTANGAEVEVEGGEPVRGTMAWSTLPLPVLARLTDPPPPAAVLEAAGRLRFRAMVLVYLVLDTERYSPFDAHYLPSGSTPVTRVSEPRNYRDSPHDPPGRTVLCAEIPCAPGDALWRAGEQQLQAVVRGALTGAGLADPVPVGVVVRRLERAYPIYDRGYETAFGALDAWVEAIPQLLTFGRQGLFAHDNAHHALAMAWAAADALGPDGRFDRGAWAAARARFAEHVVED